MTGTAWFLLAAWGLTLVGWGYTAWRWSQTIDRWQRAEDENAYLRTELIGERGSSRAEW